MTESCALPTIWTLVNAHERRRNLRRGYTIGYMTSRRCFVIAVSPRPSANPECRVLEHQPVGPRPRPGGEQRPLSLSRLLETSLRAGVWPDSVQVLGGTLASRLPARSRVWLYSGLRTAGHRGAVWLKRGVPGSQKQCPPRRPTGSGYAR